MGTLTSNNITNDQANKLLILQREIMEKLALGREQEYQIILDQLCKASELLIPDAIASIMTYDDTHSHLEVLSAPSLPEDAIDALNGLVPGEQAGSCGTAVYSNEPQFVFDTKSDFRWSGFQQFIIDFTVGACWSMPIKINNLGAIGSFALSSFEERKPSAFYINLLETSASIAGVIIKRQMEQKHLWKMAHYDVLTNLPNRTLLTLRLQHALDKIQNSKQKIAVLFLDLDNFKSINDTQGHDVGDEVLKLVSTQIKSILRPDDTFSRLGGDEFVIIIDTFKNNHELDIICNKILSAVKACSQLINFSVSTSIGVCIAPDHGESINILMRNADTAMYEAKSQGLSKFHIYQQRLTENVQKKLQLSQDMSTALLKKQFILHYQAQFDSKAENILGIEVLVRWQHDKKGLIPPVDFIPLAEENGLILDLGLYILRQACEQCLEWWQQGIPKCMLAVNISAKQLQSGFSDQVYKLLQELQFPISYLEFEITESTVMQNTDFSELQKLNDLGINIAMDDFGTGHSSLARLKQLPIGTLKIDRSFVNDIPNNKDDVIMAQAIISMGHSLGLKVIAEGVETDQQRQFLAEAGCDLLQGFLLSKPIPASKMAILLKQNLPSNS